MRNLEKMKQIKTEAEEVSKASKMVIRKLYSDFIRFVNPKGFLKKVVIISMVLIFVNISSTMPSNSAAQPTPEKSDSELYVESVKTKMTSQLVKEVDNYIKKMAPTSTLTPELVVDKCLRYNVDIIFVLSQALLESHFGTKGKAARTNSVWNVGTYDNGKILYTYKTPDESLEPYLKLINEKYLINITTKGDTVYKDLHHLVEDRGYTNVNGYRFASAKGYENAMRKLMVKIDMETSISFYQDIIKLDDYQMLAYFNPNFKEENNTDFLYALNN